MQPVRFCSPKTAAAGTCHSSFCEATVRCIFSSGHSTAMGHTRCRASPTRQGDRLFATLKRRSGTGSQCRWCSDSEPSCRPPWRRLPCHKADFQQETFQIAPETPALINARSTTATKDSGAAKRSICFKKGVRRYLPLTTLSDLALEHVATVGPEPVDFGLPPDWSTEELAHVSAQNLSFVESIFSQNPSLRVLFSKGDTGKLTSVEK